MALGHVHIFDTLCRKT